MSTAQDRAAKIEQDRRVSTSFFRDLLVNVEEKEVSEGIDIFAPSASDIRNLFVRTDIARKGRDAREHR